jgi:4,5-DOPA dioxygenase extradiol
MPAVFLGHGNPMNAIQHNAYTDAWRALAATLPRPRQILSISAHWYLPGSRVTIADALRWTSPTRCRNVPVRRSLAIESG